MAIDKNIYNNGIKGFLSYWEISNLPYDYEGYKTMFRDATKRRESAELERKSYIGMKDEETAMMIHKFFPKVEMSKLEEQKRIIQVLTRASYGMNRELAYQKCEDYGVMTKWQKFKMALKFIFNFKMWWNLFMLRRNLVKKWKPERKNYKDKIKEIEALRKQAKKEGKNCGVDMWYPRPGCGM
jgi:hypothetical protein